MEEQTYRGVKKPLVFLARIKVLIWASPPLPKKPPYTKLSTCCQSTTVSEQGSTCEGELRPFELQRGVLLGNQSVPSPAGLLDGFPKEELPAYHTVLGANVWK